MMLPISICSVRSSCFSFPAFKAKSADNLIRAISRQHSLGPFPAVCLRWAFAMSARKRRRSSPRD